MSDQRPATSFAFVQTYDAKPKRCLFEVLAAQGTQANQHVTFITDGGEDIRDLLLHLNPQAEHILDRFHVTMRITVIANIAKGLRSSPPDHTSGRICAIRVICARAPTPHTRRGPTGSPWLGKPPLRGRSPQRRTYTQRHSTERAD